MAAEQRKLLEQLMGHQSTSRAAQLSLTDPKDLGQCPKVHSEQLKAEYEALSDREKQRYGFDYDYMRDLQKYIDDCNRRIDAAQKRLEKTPDEIRQTNVLLKTISELSASIANGQLEIEVLASMNEVSRAVDENSASNRPCS
ncbi:splicing factor [Metarhizium acridum]|nr:splicing factor [Metarhizium acridum]